MYFEKPRHLSKSETELLHASFALSAKTFLKELEKGVHNYVPIRVGTKENPVVIFPHIAKGLGLDYIDFVPIEYKGVWVVVSGNLNT